MSANEMTVELLLRAHAPRAPEALRARVLELEPRPTPTPSRRLVLVLAVALLAAVAAAVVHGLVSSGPKPQQLQRAVDGAAKAPHVYANTPSIAGAPTRLQHYEATLDVRVSNVSSATSHATRIATSLGGYAESVTYSSSSRTSSLVLRVPVQNVKAALSRLTALGTIVSQNLSVTDLQHDLQVETAQIAELRRTIAALTAALRSLSLPDAQRVILQIRLANAKRSLSERLHARTGTIAAGTTARLSLTLSTKRSLVPAAHHRGRLGRMVHSAIGFLALEGTVALYALIVLSPVALLAALLWSLREARRRRDERLVME
jgi:Domain of unknown function (DUF4349)